MNDRVWMTRNYGMDIRQERLVWYTRKMSKSSE